MITATPFLAAAAEAKLGLKARLVQESWVDWPDSVNDLSLIHI